MASKYEIVNSLRGRLYLQGAPVVVAGGNLLRETQSGRIVAQLKIENVSNKNIKSARVSFQTKNANGEVIEENAEFLYDGLNVANGEMFGQQTPVYLIGQDVVSYEVSVTEVTFSNGTKWASKEKWSVISDSASTNYQPDYRTYGEYTYPSEQQVDAQAQAVARKPRKQRESKKLATIMVIIVIAIFVAIAGLAGSVANVFTNKVVSYTYDKTEFVEALESHTFSSLGEVTDDYDGATLEFEDGVMTKTYFNKDDSDSTWESDPYTVLHVKSDSGDYYIICIGKVNFLTSITLGTYTGSILENYSAGLYTVVKCNDDFSEIVLQDSDGNYYKSNSTTNSNSNNSSDQKKETVTEQTV